jgi:hypothetical protein
VSELKQNLKRSARRHEEEEKERTKTDDAQDARLDSELSQAGWGRQMDAPWCSHTCFPRRRQTARGVLKCFGAGGSGAPFGSP